MNDTNKRDWTCPQCRTVFETDLSMYEAMAQVAQTGAMIQGLGDVRCPQCQAPVRLAHVVGDDLAARLGLNKKP